MFGFSASHLLILLIVLLVFGHRRLPEIGHALGKGLGSFKRGLEGLNEPGHEIRPPAPPKVAELPEGAAKREATPQPPVTG